MDGRPALATGGSSFQPHDMREAEAELSRVLDGHHSLGAVDLGRQRVEQRRLTGARGAADDQVAAIVDEPTHEVLPRT